MKKKRCRHHIVAEVLQLLAMYGDMGITEICMRVNIPVDRGKELLNSLVNYGLVYGVEVDGRIKYRITDIGYRYLKLFEMMKNIFPL